MRQLAKGYIYSVNETYQQIKSLECEMSLIGSKELAEKKIAKSLTMKVNCERNVKLCLLDVYQLF